MNIVIHFDGRHDPSVLKGRCAFLGQFGRPVFCQVNGLADFAPDIRCKEFSGIQFIGHRLTPAHVLAAGWADYLTYVEWQGGRLDTSVMGEHLALVLQTGRSELVHRGEGVFIWSERLSPHA